MVVSLASSIDLFDAKPDRQLPEKYDWAVDCKRSVRGARSETGVVGVVD